MYNNRSKEATQEVIKKIQKRDVKHGISIEVLGNDWIMDNLKFQLPGFVERAEV